MAKIQESRKVTKALRKAGKQGYRVRITAKGHAIVYHPDGVSKVTVAIHTGHEKKQLAQLRKIGVNF